MVTLLKTEGGTQVYVSANVEKTIQSIKEIVRNHSDSEIYNTLKETNMDPNETAQKLLNQGKFLKFFRFLLLILGLFLGFFGWFCFVDFLFWILRV